jgi:NADH-quinone oxidoreductase chain I
MVQYFADIFHSVNSALKGMGVTIKHFVRKPVTLQYPDERWVLPERFRGFVHNDIIRCNACMGCAKACPVSCIYIETEGKGKERHMTRWAVDFNKCIWCGFCTDPCPTEAVTMSHDYDHSLYFRKNLVYEFVPADEPVPCHKEKRLAMGYYVEEKAKPAAESSSTAKKTVTANPAAEKPAEPAAGEDKASPPEPDKDDKGVNP